MRKTTTIAIFLSVLAGAAQAHPGSAILTVGGADERTAMTEGVRFEETNGVHVFRGRARLAGDKPAPAVAKAPCHADVVVEKVVWRSFRTLRTQGFYSGRGKTRRYTQGFYSGN